jgi:F-box and WD-40 domain protein CDC4
LSLSRGLATGGYETPQTTKISRHLRLEDGSESRLSRRVQKRPRSPDSLGKFSGASLQTSLHNSQRNNNDTSSFSNNNDFTSAALSTPNLSEVEPSLAQGRPTLSRITSTSDTSCEDDISPTLTAPHLSFPTAVATPPIADSDLEPFAALSGPLVEPTVLRHPLNSGVTQGASLPSPSLSPTLAAANLHNSNFPIPDEVDLDASDNAAHSQSAMSQESYSLSDSRQPTPMYNAIKRQAESSKREETTVMDAGGMLDAFDSMPAEMKTFMMYQLLRRCTRKTLHVVADVVNPALKCDFLEELPPELSLHILSFLDHKDLCHAAQVSKRWRNIIDTNEAGWKELFDRDKFVLSSGELERAIVEGWGWQDPHGPDGWEEDLSQRPISSEGETSNSSVSKFAVAAPPSGQRTITKRKRTITNGASDRSKRRAVSVETKERRRASSSKFHNSSLKSEGPSAAATAAALAVPAPNLGLPSLSKLHLFKSLYRRHYMIRNNWRSTKILPQHVAFPAHPRHVITCLQFDDDKIITGSDDTFIHIYNTKTGALRKRLEGHEGGVWALQYEGGILVSGSTDRSVRVWDIEKGQCTQVFHGHTSTVRCLQILMPVNTGKISKGKAVMVPEKPLIITGSRDSQLRVWKLPEQGGKRYLPSGPPPNDSDCPYFIRVLQGHTHSVRAIAAHEDTLVSGSYDHSVRVWRISTGETVHQLRGHVAKVYSVVLDKKRNRCISGSMDNSVKIWSLETGSCLYTLEGHSSLVGLLDLRDDRLVSAAADSTLRIWDPEKGQCKSTLTAHTGAITCFQHDGTKVVSGSDRTLKMWDVKSGECLSDLLTDLSGVWQVKFDERRCVAAVQRDGLTFIEVCNLRHSSNRGN